METAQLINKSRNILIIDDELEITKALVRQFKRSYGVFSASNTEDALQILKKEPIQVIISDQRMPGMTGVEFFSNIKTDFPEVIKLILTGYSDIETAIAAINHGQVFRYITKPWHPDELDSIVKEAFEKHELLIANKKLINSLNEANIKLEKKVRERTRALEEQNASLILQEEEIRENLTQYGNLANSGLSLIWTAGTDKLCTFFNETWLKFTGRTLEQELGNGWSEGVHPDDLNRCLDTFVTAFDKREAFEMEYRIKHVSGEYRWILDLGSPNYNSNNEFIGYIGNCFDITERKKMQVLLENERALYLDLVNTQPAGIYRIKVFSKEKWKENAWKNSENPPYIMELVSDRFGEILEIDINTFRTNPGIIIDLVHPDDKAEFVRKNEEANTLLITFSWDCRLLINNKIKWIHFESIPRKLDNGDILFTGIIYDITERKLNEYKAQLNSKRLKALVDILQYSSDSIQDYLDYALKLVIEITESKIGYIYHYSEQKKEFVLNTWSNEVMNTCKIVEQQTVYQLDLTGLWGEAVRQRKPIMVNDFQAFNPHKKGYPEGHAPLYKYLTLPVFYNNQIVGVVGVANKETDYVDEDISQLTILMDIIWKSLEKKKSDLALIQSEERYKNLLLHLETGIVVHAPDTSIVMCNPKATQLLGLSHEQLTGKTTFDSAWRFLDSENKPYLHEDFPVVKIKNTRESINNQIIGIQNNSNKDITWVTVNGFPVLNAHGEIAEIVISFNDISIRMNAEKELKRQYELFNVLIENLPVGVFMAEAPSGKPLVANKKAKELLGRGILPEANSINLHEVYHSVKANTKQPYPLEEMPIIKAMYGESSFVDDMLVIRPDNTQVLLEVYGSPVKNEHNEVFASLVNFTDITDRKLAEEALLKSQKLLSDTEKIGKVGGWEFNMDTLEQSWTEETYEIHELPFNFEATVEKGINFYTPESLPIIQNAVKLAIEKAEPYDLELEIITAKGNRKYVHTIGKTDIEGRRIYGFFQDITERKKAEIALKESEEKLSSLFNTMTELVVLHELVFDDKGEVYDYIITDCNKAFMQFIGLAYKDIVGKKATSLYNTEIPPYLQEYVNVCFSGESIEFNTYFEPMDKYFMISAVASGKNRFSTISTDVTTHEQINQVIKDKNKELENYIYVVSHDLRSPLVNIQGFSQRLQKQTNQMRNLVSGLEIHSDLATEFDKLTDLEIPKSINFILNNVSKMDSLIHGLLQLSRFGQIKLNVNLLNMNKLLNKIISSFNFQLTELDAKVIVHDLIDCFGDENQLNQLFSNIIGNAVKYSDKNKKLIIEISSKAHYNNVIYSIKDNGTGINQRHLERIWDVFYRVDATAGEAGEGLGLSLAKRIVDKHQGRIWAESTEGVGSTFFVELQRNNFEKLN